MTSQVREWPAPQWVLNDDPAWNALFWDRAMQLELRLLRRVAWGTDVETIAELPGKLLELDDHGHAQYAVAELGDALVAVVVDAGQVRATVAAANAADCSAAYEELRRLFPPAEPQEGNVPVTFWTYSPNGPRAVTRRIAVAPWDVIAGNYSAETRHRLDGMMDGFRPSHGGQLVLWQGEPGTGKTHALRALAWEWRDWADLHYVVDPEQLFGDHADYLIEVLLHEGYSGEAEHEEERWRVLLLEDTGELLAADAKERTGQALSRLLNTVDGMIGQGLRILVLVTTNDELKALHPAVQRPGRCALRVSFDELSLDDARAWIRRRGGDPAQARNGMSLAELYAAADGFAERPLAKVVGFGS